MKGHYGFVAPNFIREILPSSRSKRPSVMVKFAEEDIPIISFVEIDPKTGLQTDNNKGIMESYIQGTEPFNKEVMVLDSLGSVTTETVSGTGSLIIN